MTHSTRTSMVGTDRIVDDVHRSDDTFRAWMRGHLAHAATRFDVSATGNEVWGWCLRSLGVPVRTAQGRPCWLRVGTERFSDVRDPVMGAFWTGIPDSAAVTGVPMPEVLASMEWAAPGQGRMVRADLTTLLPGRTCSDTDVLYTPPPLPDEWWSQLRESADRIAATPTSRFADRNRSSGPNQVREVFGDQVADARMPTRWVTAHGDLHWANVLGPQFGMLDWELWGSAPAGTDAATLLTFSLLVPATAARVYATFADVLDTPDGQYAQLRAAARILRRDKHGQYPALADAVRRHIQPVIDAAIGPRS